MTMPKPILTRPERAIPETEPEGAIKLPLGIRNNNPFNIRFNKRIPWEGKVPGEDPQYEGFATPFHGLRAAVKNTLTHQSKYGANTVEKLISRHAPDIENPTPGFIKFVSGKMGVKPKEKIDLTEPWRMKRYVRAVIEFENSHYKYDEDLLDEVMENVYGL